MNEPTTTGAESWANDDRFIRLCEQFANVRLGMKSWSKMREDERAAYMGDMRLAVEVSGLMPADALALKAEAINDIADVLGLPTGSTAKDAVEGVRRLAAQVPQWIPCSERMPERGAVVLTLCPGVHDACGGVETGVWDDKRFSATRNGWAGWLPAPSHWMPLPAGAKP